MEDVLLESDGGRAVWIGFWKGDLESEDGIGVGAWFLREEVRYLDMKDGIRVACAMYLSARTARPSRGVAPPARVLRRGL